MIRAEKNYLTIDFTQGTIEYEPFIRKIRFIIKEKGEETILTEIFFDWSAAEKLRHICNYLAKRGKPAELVCMSRDEERRLDILIAMSIQNFPVVDFAKSFSLTSIIERGVEEMHVIISALAEIEIIDNSFNHWVNQVSPECNLSINSLDPKNGLIIEENIATVPAFIASRTISM